MIYGIIIIYTILSYVTFGILLYEIDLGNLPIGLHDFIIFLISLIWPITWLVIFWKERKNKNEFGNKK